MIKDKKIKADGSVEEKKEVNVDKYGRPLKFMVKERLMRTAAGKEKKVMTKFEIPAGHMNRKERRQAGKEHARRMKHEVRGRK